MSLSRRFTDRRHRLFLECVPGSNTRGSYAVAPWRCCCTGGASVTGACEGVSRRTRAAELRHLQTNGSSTLGTEHSCVSLRITVSLRSFIHLLSAMSAHTSVLILITLWASVEDGEFIYNLKWDIIVLVDLS